jgi:hypothetical protein
MNANTHNPNQPAGDPAGVADATLRLIATLPVPEGLEDRVHATLRSAQLSRRGSVLAWPVSERAGSSWMRTAAAAAIAFVIVGGGWSVYSHVPPGQSMPAAIAPPRLAPGSFSGAGAIRTPQTLNGPVVAHPAAHAAAPAKSAHKPAAQSAQSLTPESTPDSAKGGKPAAPEKSTQTSVAPAAQ